MATTDYDSIRKAKDEHFRTARDSPLGNGDRSGFEGLDYFDPRPDLVYTAPVVPGDGVEVHVDTSDDRQKVFRDAGSVQLEIAGVPVSLTLYDTGHPGLFLPFVTPPPVSRPT
ncbi:MAG: DUF1684 domain-containing protein [Acidimicrobiia bacterium]|jgi:uncharacterized protein (DUF1684 family)